MLLLIIVAAMLGLTGILGLCIYFAPEERALRRRTRAIVRDSKALRAKIKRNRRPKVAALRRQLFRAIADNPRRKNDVYTWARHIPR